MRWCKSPEKYYPLEVFKPIDGPEGGPERPSIPVILWEVGDIVDLAEPTADQLAVFVEHGRPVEPVAGRDDHVVESVDLGRPRLVKFVQVEVEKARARRTGFVGFFGPDQKGCREYC